MGKHVRPGFRVLMVDDSAEDIFLVKRAMSKRGNGEFFHAVSDGQEAIAYLCAEGKYEDRQQYPFPNVLLLDLKMPGLDGFGLLEWLQQHPACKVIPTIAFTSSNIDSDVHQVYVLGGNAYLVKPSNFEDMIEMLDAMYRFWSRCETPAPPPGERCC